MKYVMSSMTYNNRTASYHHEERQNTLFIFLYATLCLEENGGAVRP